MKKYTIKRKNEVFSENFNFLMFSKKLTLKAIAQKTNLSLSSISTWKRGRIPRDKTIITTLAKIFEVHPDELFKVHKHKSIPIFSNERKSNHENDYDKYLNLIIKHITKILKKTEQQRYKNVYQKIVKTFPIK